MILFEFWGQFLRGLNYFSLFKILNYYVRSKISLQERLFRCFEIILKERGVQLVQLFNYLKKVLDMLVKFFQIDFLGEISYQVNVIG